MNVIDTFWRATTRELIHIVWLKTKFCFCVQELFENGQLAGKYDTI